MKDQRPIHPGNLQCFLDEYEIQLKKAITERPQDYMWKISEFDAVFNRMKSAIERGTFNKDSDSIRRTCKTLNIKHTYKAIRDFITL